MSPLGRPAQPAEMAQLYVSAANPLLSYSTGQIRSDPAIGCVNLRDLGDAERLRGTHE